MIPRVLICLAFIFIVIPLVVADDLRITLESYDPKPVVPGSFFTATFRVDNIAGENLTNVDIELDVSSPFFVEGSSDLTINSLEEGESETFSFSVGVRSSATSGFETIDIDWQTVTDDGTESFSIQVKAIETTLVVESVESLPAEIAPGEEATVTIKLKNNANLLLKDIKVKLNLASAELPFAPIGGVTERSIDTLQAGGSRELEFRIIAIADAASQIYKVPLEISYFDEFGQQFQIKDVIALIVGSKPILNVNIMESTLVTGRKGIVSIEIVNRGLTDARFLNVRLISSVAFETLSSSTAYIGDVDSDDVESIDFELLVAGEGFLELPLQLTYRDANNKLYTESFRVQARVYSIEEAKSLGLIKTNTTLIITLTAIAIVILYFIFRRMFRRRRH